MNKIQRVRGGIQRRLKKECKIYRQVTEQSRLRYAQIEDRQLTPARVSFKTVGPVLNSDSENALYIWDTENPLPDFNGEEND